MAKRATLANPKTRRLARALEIVPGMALGLLETLWSWVGTYARDGALSRLDMIEVLEYGGWHRFLNADAVLSAMADEANECVWLDPLPDGRFYVHDWHEHCDDAIHGGLYRAKSFFANGAKPKARGVMKSEADDLKNWWDSAVFSFKPQVSHKLATSEPQVSNQWATSEKQPRDDGGNAGNNGDLNLHKFATCFPQVSHKCETGKPSQSQVKAKSKITPQPPTALSAEKSPPAPATEGGNSSPPLPEPAAPEASLEVPMVMLVHGMEPRRGAGIPDPATATDDELLAYAAKRRKEARLDDPGGDAA